MKSKKAASVISTLLFVFMTLVLVIAVLFVIGKASSSTQKNIIDSRLLDNIHIKQEQANFYLKQAAYDAIILAYSEKALSQEYIPSSCNGEFCSKPLPIFNEEFQNKIKKYIQIYFSTYDFTDEDRKDDLKEDKILDNLKEEIIDGINLDVSYKDSAVNVEKKDFEIYTTKMSDETYPQTKITDIFETKRSSTGLSDDVTSDIGLYQADENKWPIIGAIQTTNLKVDINLDELKLKSFDEIYNAADACCVLGKTNIEIQTCINDKTGGYYTVSVTDDASDEKKKSISLITKKNYLIKEAKFLNIGYKLETIQISFVKSIK